MLFGDALELMRDEPERDKKLPTFLAMHLAFNS